MEVVNCHRAKFIFYSFTYHCLLSHSFSFLTTPTNKVISYTQNNYFNMTQQNLFMTVFKGFARRSYTTKIFLQIYIFTKYVCPNSFKKLVTWWVALYCFFLIANQKVHCEKTQQLQTNAKQAGTKILQCR